MKKVLLKLLLQAIEDLYDQDYRNLILEVSERNLCGRLAFHLENLMRQYDKDHNKSFFKEYFADIEYNRMEDLDGKPLKKTVIFEDGTEETIICDMLVHSRGRNKKMDNLMALEMKRTYNKDSVESDNKRLITMVSPPSSNVVCKIMYSTLMGVFLTCDKTNCLITVYEWDSKAEGYRILMDNVEIVKK